MGSAHPCLHPRRLHRRVGCPYSGAPPANYNTFNLLIAEIGFDWEKTSLDFGTNGSMFGMVPTFSLSNSWNFAGYGGKGAAPVAPQVTVH